MHRLQYLMWVACFTSWFVFAAPPPAELSDTMQTPPPLMHEQTTAANHNKLFNTLSRLCGKAFAGTLEIDTSGSERFSGQELVMHVRQCEENKIFIPFHVGNDHSRTWIIERTRFGLGLKHDHRNADGSHSKLTMYGGIAQSASSSNRIDFPVDAYSQEMLLALGYPQSVTNVWSFFVYDDFVSYQLTREGFVFRVKFDTRNEVDLPPTPWGY